MAWASLNWKRGMIKYIGLKSVPLRPRDDPQKSPHPKIEIDAIEFLYELLIISFLFDNGVPKYSWHMPNVSQCLYVPIVVGV